MLTTKSSPDRPATKQELQTTFEQRMTLTEEAIDQYGSFVQNYLFSLTNQWQDAQDLATKLWIYVLHKFPEDKITNPGLLKRKSYQLFVDHYRAKKRRGEICMDIPPETPSPAHKPDAFTEKEDQALKTQFFEEYNADLTNGQKDSLWLHARHGYTFKEISTQMKIPSSTIGDWIKSARIKLAETL